MVALPVGALATAAAILSPRVRNRCGTLSVAVLTVGALGAFLAKESGEGLAETETLPVLHSQFGSATAVVGLATMVLAWVWWWLTRRRPWS